VGTERHPISRGKVIWVQANLRGGPGLDHKVVGRAFSGNNLEILDESSGWLRVRLESGKDGWISKRAVSEVFKSSSPPKLPAPRVDPLKPQAPSKPQSPM
jgi:SH3-like domain-containing protein